MTRKLAKDIYSELLLAGGRVNPKVILVELNEVPYRVIDAYREHRPRSALARILEQSDQYETVTEDSLVLDPWVSWPTLHRGVPDEMHSILHLGQVLTETDERYPPIWRILKQHGVQVGVFGSLHSSNVPNDVLDYSFYLPDYFGADTFAHPASLLPFQALNLAMTRQSARNVTRKLPMSAVAKFIMTAPQVGLTAATVSSSIAQIAREITNPVLRIRRRSFQPLFMADLFLTQLKRKQPDFSTFYTNHVAAAMHRYWGAAFPEDYAKPMESDWIARYASEIFFAMDKFDVILKRLVDFVDSHSGYTMIIASSMGQAAIAAEQTYDFLTIVDLPKFMAAMGVPQSGWEVRPAMVPVQCVVVQDSFRENLLSHLMRLRAGGAGMVASQRPIAPMSYDEREKGFFQIFIQFDNYAGGPQVQIGDRSHALSELGLGLSAHEDGVNCTAQHVPSGSLIVYRGAATTRSLVDRVRVSTLDVAPSLLNTFGIASPPYMRGKPNIQLTN